MRPPSGAARLADSALVQVLRPAGSATGEADSSRTSPTCEERPLQLP
jgi:hypothetical protein